MTLNGIESAEDPNASYPGPFDADVIENKWKRVGGSPVRGIRKELEAQDRLVEWLHTTYGGQTTLERYWGGAADRQFAEDILRRAEASAYVSRVVFNGERIALTAKGVARAQQLISRPQRGVA